jgi:NAD-dependent dihydropyrimidine dehydrogenase PreA subunit
MAYTINADDCTACGACESECTSGAIYLDDASGKYAINPDLCSDCGVCYTYCPMEIPVQI